MKKKLFLTLTVIALTTTTGCTTTYHKADGSDAELKRDWYDCKAKNRAADPAMLLVAIQNARECMLMEKGYTIQ